MGDERREQRGGRRRRRRLRAGSENKRGKGDIKQEQEVEKREMEDWEE